MNIEEARKVLWLKNNHKTLGELLDEGFLNQSKLEWAAEKAFDPTLKQAAKVILDSKKNQVIASKAEDKNNKREANSQGNSIEIGMPLDQARSTLWPFSQNKGQPMGMLVESKQLTLKDLVYAIEHAWDEKVKQAAIALSLLRLKQAVKEPVPSAGFVHVVSGGRSFSQRRETFLTMILGMILGFSFASVVYFSLKLARPASQPNSNARSIAEVVSTPAGILALITFIGIIVFGFWLINFVLDKITARFDREIEQHRFGQEGEERAVQIIIQALDGNWHLFRNITLPGRNKADLDLILVGPPGVWSLEVKNFHGEYRNIGENWEYRHGNKWKATSKSPSRQALNGAVRLGNFLKADHVKAFVNPAVVWANAESPLFVENPLVAVWQHNRLSDELGNIWQGEKLAKAEREKIIEKLTKLCDLQKKDTRSN